MVVSAGDKMTNLLGVIQRALRLVEELFHLPIIITGAPHFIPAFFLQQRACPLREIPAPMALRIPGAAMDFDFLGRRKSPQIFTDVDGRKAERSGTVAVQDRP